jgi:hypothetical protein
LVGWLVGWLVGLRVALMHGLAALLGESMVLVGFVGWLLVG